MYAIPLSAVPNQSIAFNVDGAYWQLHVYQAVDRMYVDVTLNGDAIILGVRCFGGLPLMPYEYLHMPRFGNFIFDSDADWTLFGVSCFLYYLPLAEYEEYKALQVSSGAIIA